MRPGQNNNKRMRGNRPSNNRRGPNPLTRSYESNGPDVKIRGNAHHIAEKYLQFARDAHTGGDPVAAENYLQHAEHYFRLIAAAQAAQAQAQSGSPAGRGRRREFEDDDDFGGVADRFASPAERAPVPYTPHSRPRATSPRRSPASPAPARSPTPKGANGRPKATAANKLSAGPGTPAGRPSVPSRIAARATIGLNDRQGDNRQGETARGRARFSTARVSSLSRAPMRRAIAQPVAGRRCRGGVALFHHRRAARHAPLEAETSGGRWKTGLMRVGRAIRDRRLRAIGDARFPGRGRRRRLRSPYGFHPSGNQDEEGEGPLHARRHAGLASKRQSADQQTPTLSNFDPHVIAVERLHHEVVGAGVHRPGDLRDIVFAGAEDDLGTGRRPASSRSSRRNS